MKFFRRYFLDEKGATAVEFGMVSLLFLGFLFGIIELGRVFWTWNTLQYAVEETVRYALVHPLATNAELVTYAANSMAGIQVDTSLLTVSTSTSVVSGIQFVQVDGSYVFTAVVPFFSGSLGTLNLTAQSRIPYAL